MKKIISLFLCAVCIVTLAAVSQTTTLAAETAEVPKLYITTDNGSGLSLQKEDGYTRTATPTLISRSRTTARASQTSLSS